MNPDFKTLSIICHPAPKITDFGLELFVLICARKEQPVHCTSYSGKLGGRSISFFPQFGHTTNSTTSFSPLSPFLLLNMHPLDHGRISCANLFRKSSGLTYVMNLGRISFEEFLEEGRETESDKTEQNGKVEVFNVARTKKQQCRNQKPNYPFIFVSKTEEFK